MDASVASWLDQLYKAATGEPAPPPRDTITSIENRVKDATDDDLSGITSQLFGARGLPEVVSASLGERDHLWTFMAPMERPLAADDELSFVVRDMNYFVSSAGIIDESTLRKLG